MLTYSIRRILSAIPTLLIILALTFFLLRLAPGGPFDGDKVWPPEIQANIDRKYGLDLPLYQQFAVWIGDLLQGDLKESFQYIGMPVSDIIAKSLPLSFTLGAWALFLAIVIGIPLGCIAAWKQNSWLDTSSMFLAIAGVSIPSYLLASILILIFAMWLGWLPPALFDGPSSLVLPVLTLAVKPIAMVARLTRTSMIEAAASDYIRTAYAKGLSDEVIVFKHALRNSLIPVVTLLGPLAAGLVTGSFVVEVVFQIPGIGKHFVSAVLNRDYPLVMGVTLTYGVILLGANLLVDLTYGLIDPRIRVSSEESS